MKTKLISLITVFSMGAGLAAAAPPTEEGKNIFMTRCAACHTINKDLTGPALAGVYERRSIEWIISFVHSSQTMVKNGDKDAVALFEKFNKTPMPDHPDLSEDQIKNIMEYIKVESSNAAAVKKDVPSKLKTPYKPLSLNDYGFFIGFFAVVAMLMMALYFAVHSKTLERNMRGKSLPS